MNSTTYSRHTWYFMSYVLCRLTPGYLYKTNFWPTLFPAPAPPGVILPPGRCLVPTIHFPPALLSQALCCPDPIPIPLSSLPRWLFQCVPHLILCLLLYSPHTSLTDPPPPLPLRRFTARRTPLVVVEPPTMLMSPAGGIYIWPQTATLPHVAHPRIPVSHMFHWPYAPTASPWSGVGTPYGWYLPH